MSGDTRVVWWRSPEGEAETTPARIRQPEMPQCTDPPTRLSAPEPTQAIALSPAAGKPHDLYGRVLLWKPRTVELARFLTILADERLRKADPQRQCHSRAAGPRTGVSPSSPDDELQRLFLSLQPPLGAALSLSGPLNWPAGFYPFQCQGIQTLIQSERLLLADDMGLGKTVQAIAAARILILRREMERALVITPAGLLEQWKLEIARWAPELRVTVVHGSPRERIWRWRASAHVTLTSYETLRSDVATNAAGGPYRRTWDLVLLDEAQKIRNRETDVAAACKLAPRRRSWALTGTPLENRIEDIVSILEFVAEEGAGATPLYTVRSLLGEYQLRRRKHDVLSELPEKIITEIALPMTEAQKWSYDRARKEGLVELLSSDAIRVEHALALLLRLKQICNFDPGAGDSAKLNDLTTRLEELSAEGHKAIIFSQFVDNRFGVRRLLKELRRFSPLGYIGEMSQSERTRALERFQEDADCRVLVISLQAGGYGLNLQNASYVFHFDRWWNPAAERQAEARAHRLGQAMPVHVYRYVLQGTVEEQIAGILAEKEALFETVVEDASLDAGAMPDREELLRLLGVHHPGESNLGQ